MLKICPTCHGAFNSEISKTCPRCTTPELAAQNANAAPVVTIVAPLSQPLPPPSDKTKINRACMKCGQEFVANVGEIPLCQNCAKPLQAATAEAQAKAVSPVVETDDLETVVARERKAILIHDLIQHFKSKLETMPDDHFNNLVEAFNAEKKAAAAP